MNISTVEAAQVTGTASILFLFLINFYIAVVESSFEKSGRVALLWTTIYILFLFIVRSINLIDNSLVDALRIISGFSSLIPLIAVIWHLFLNKKIIEEA